MTWLVRPSSSTTLDPRTLRRDRDLHVASQQELPRYLLQSWLPAQFRSGALAEKGDMADKFRALLVTKDGNRQSVAVTELTDADLMEGDVTVAVEHSTVNYKDGLAITGKGADHPQIPTRPRHRLAGKVLRSEDSRFQVGDRVVLNGYGLGEVHHGGYAERARSGVTGLSGSLRIFRPPMPWRSAPPAIPRCFACWPWKRQASRRTGVMCS